MSVQISTSINKRAIPANNICQISCAVTIEPQAPMRPLISNMAICVILDTSGSMVGSKLTAAKAAINYLLDNIDDSCKLSLITFNTDVQPITGQFEQVTSEFRAQLVDALDSIQAAGNTNISGAICEFTQQLCTAGDMPVEALLLTDGHNNAGLPIRDVIEDIGRQVNARPYTINTFSVGPEPDARLLQQIAETSASGMYYNIDTIDAVPDKVGELCANFKSLVGYNTKITIQARAGARILRTFGGRAHSQSIKAAQFVCGSLYGGVERAILVTFALRKIAPTDDILTEDGLHNICDITVEYKSIDKLICVRPTKQYSQTISVNRAAQEIEYNNSPDITLLELRYSAKNIIEQITQLCDRRQYAEAVRRLDEYREAAVEKMEQMSLRRSNEINVLYTDILAKLDTIRDHIYEDKYQRGRNYILGVESVYTEGRSGGYVSESQKTECRRASDAIARYTSFYGCNSINRSIDRTTSQCGA